MIPYLRYHRFLRIKRRENPRTPRALLYKMPIWQTEHIGHPRLFSRLMIHDASLFRTERDCSRNPTEFTPRFGLTSITIRFGEHISHVYRLITLSLLVNDTSNRSVLMSHGREQAHLSPSPVQLSYQLLHGGAIIQTTWNLMRKIQSRW